MRLIDSESLYQRFLDYQSKHRNRNLDIDEIRIIILDEPTSCDIDAIRQEITDICAEEIDNDPRWAAGLHYSLRIIN